MSPGPGEQLNPLYRDIVLDHSRNPRNFRRLEPADASAEGHNALCGDKITVYLRLADDRLADVAYEASGCAISLASASLMSEATRGRSRADALAAAGDFLAALAPGSRREPAGDLAALGGVRAYPSRVRCATLPWQTLKAALDGGTRTVTTE